jgi:heat shock protein HtpX
MAAAALQNTDFESAIARNKRNTLFLIAALVWVSAVLGYVLGWAWGITDEIWNMSPAKLARFGVADIFRDLAHLPPRPESVWGMVLLVGFGAAWGLITLFAGARILAAFVGARPADPSNPAERVFINVVEEMAIAAGLPMPQPMVVETEALNAFASGASPASAHITATSALLAAMNREELQGVIGHEMGHVLDFDVRYTTVVAAMAGILVLIQHLLLDMARFGSFSSRGNDREGGSRGILSLVVFLIVGIVAIGAALAAKLVQFAVSREREYLADATSAKLTRNPVGLIHALQRLDHSETEMERGSSPVSALCIAGPPRLALVNAFSTHPPIEDRIARLRNLGGVALPPEAKAASASEAPTGAAPPPAPGRGPWS